MHLHKIVVHKIVVLLLLCSSTLYCAGEYVDQTATPVNQTANNAGAQITPSTGQGKTADALAPQPTDPRPGSGTLLLGELIKPLDAKKVKPGDAVECRLLQDLLYRGKVVVSHKARAWGHITEVVRASKGHPRSEVGVLFDKIVMPNKKELPFQHPAIIVALAAPIRKSTVQTTNMNDMPVLMSKGQATGGSVLDAVGANAQLAGANMPSVTGAIGVANRGVIGLKNIFLDNTNPAYSALVSQKGNLRLDFDVQILLRVTGQAQKR